MNPKKIVFVCSENISRSVIAQYCLQEYFEKEKISNIEVDSVGTSVSGSIDGYSMAHIEYMRELGMNIPLHQRKQLDKSFINSSTKLVAMAPVHQDFVKENFDIEIPTFNQILTGENTPIHVDANNINESLKKLVDFFRENIGKFYANLVNNI